MWKYQGTTSRKFLSKRLRCIKHNIERRSPLVLEHHSAPFPILNPLEPYFSSKIRFYTFPCFLVKIETFSKRRPWMNLDGVSFRRVSNPVHPKHRNISPAPSRLCSLTPTLLGCYMKSWNWHLLSHVHGEGIPCHQQVTYWCIFVLTWGYWHLFLSTWIIIVGLHDDKPANFWLSEFGTLESDPASRSQP